MISKNTIFALLRDLAVPLSLAGILVCVSFYNFLLFHTLIELFAIIIAILVAVVAWQMHAYTRNYFLLYLGCGYFWVAMLDMLHMLTYKGMTILSVTGPDVAVQLWIGARYMESFLLLSAPLFLKNTFNRYAILLFYGAASAAIVVGVMSGNFPAGFIEGKGLTPFKIYSEYLIIMILLGAVIYLSRQRQFINDDIFKLIIVSMVLTMMAELAFTFYVSVYGLSNLAGHILKLFSFWLIYIAMIRTTMKDPFSALARSEAHYDAIPNVVIMVDSEGVIRHVNNMASKYSKLTIDKLVGSDSHEIFHDGSVAADRCPVCLAVKEKKVLSAFEMQLDALVWCDYTLSYLPDENIAIEMVRDISDRKATESDLSLAQEIAHIGSWKYDVTNDFIVWSEETYKIFGITIGGLDMTYKGFIEAVHPDDRALVNRAYQSSIDECRDSYEIEHRIIKKDSGEIRFLHQRCVHKKDKTGKIIASLGMTHDVTDERKLYKIIEDKVRDQSEMLNSMVDAVITIDDTGIITTYNDTAVKLFGYDREEVIGNNIKMLMPESYSQHHDGYLKNYLKTGDARIIGTSREVTGLDKKQNKIAIRLSLSELPVDASGNRRFIGTCQDIRQINLQSEQLRRSQKMDALGKLTGGIAHDYNNMLGVIIGYADLLHDEVSGQPNLVNYANQIIHAGKRGAKLTKRLLSFSRGNMNEAISVDINKILRNEQDMIQKTLTVRINLIIDLDDAIWPVWLDSSELEDTILNMCINAMHAIEESGSLTIRTSNCTLNTLDAEILGLSSGDYVQLSITDTGCGMSDVIREKIFDPFFSTKGESGTGLGLSQVFGFVSRSGGGIKVYSEPGHGSQFSLYFPRHHASNNADGDKNNIINNDNRGDETILIVDDEVALRDLCSEILSQQGYTVLTADSSISALEILKDETIDLLLSDVIMPDMNGYELAAEVKKKYPHIKIQLVSGFVDDRYAALVDEDLHIKLLHKPYSSKILLEAIRGALDG